MKYFLCILFYRYHDPIRNPLGGFRCSRCGFAEEDALGYVPLQRSIHDRDAKTITRFWGF